MSSSLLSVSRRRFLGQVSTGLMGVGLSRLLSNDAQAERSIGPTFPAKAKRVLQIFCPGAASHLDLWDYKPNLIKYHGKPLPGDTLFPYTTLFRSDRKSVV